LALAISAGLIVATVGCQTTGESAGLGALIGAGAGAVIGGIAGDGKGAAIGAAVGAAAGAAGGAIAHDVRESRAERVVTAEQTAETYSYQPSAGQSMVFEDASVQPAVARRGEFVELRMQYALLGAPEGITITERRIVLKNDKVISQISGEEHVRNDGTWVSTQEFRVPDSWGPGEYEIEQSVSSTRLTVSGRVRLIVD
jgi:uncharacterized protein YcfJ